MFDPSSEELPPPEKYQDFVQDVELRNARLVHCNVESLAPLGQDAQVSYKIETENEFVQHDEGFEALQQCSLSFFVEEGSEDTAVGHIDVTYGFAYACTFEDDAYPTDAYLRVFEQVSLPINAWPFIRQFVHDTTQRMSWPALMLPLLKSDAEEPSGADESDS